jgi:hypothetical protein
MEVNLRKEMYLIMRLQHEKLPTTFNFYIQRLFVTKYLIGYFISANS